MRSHSETFMITSLLLSFLMLVPPEEPKIGPAAGALVIDGGGEGPETIKTFVHLPGARIHRSC